MDCFVCFKQEKEQDIELGRVGGRRGNMIKIKKYKTKIEVKYIC